MSSRVLREIVLENFEKLNEPETSTSDIPESVRVLWNKKINISLDNPITKYNSLTFSYFSYTFLNSISIEIYKLSFANLTGLCLILSCTFVLCVLCSMQQRTIINNFFKIFFHLLTHYELTEKIDRILGCHNTQTQIHNDVLRKDLLLRN